MSASETTFSHYNIKILMPKVTKNITNLRNKFCEFPPRSLSFKVVDVDGTFIFPFSFLISWQSLTSWHGTLKNLRILNFFSSKTFSFDSFRKKWKANWVDWSSRVRIEIITFQLSISPTFYEHLLHMKMFQKSFLWLLLL